MTSHFVDEAVVTFESGRGGDGSASFHREKHVPRGGPNGADGGRGGDIVLAADEHVRTLYDVRLHRHYKASDGSKAVGNKSGKDGRDVEVRVPVGTVVIDDELGEPLIDLNAHGVRYIACRGGRGGFGNLHFTNSVRQAPTIAQNGAPGETFRVKLELRLIADVGLVGLPNAGKSTLLGALSAARPKIADYPFTTLEPNLGIVKAGDDTFVMADLPGLIEGASEGRGLGHQFLRHAERTKVLVHVVDGFPIDGTDPIDNYRKVEGELELYSEELRDKRRVTVMNKCDLASQEDTEVMLGFFCEAGISPMPISAATGQGLKELVFMVKRLLDDASKDQPVHVVTPTFRRATEATWGAHRADADTFVVRGERVERLVQMTKLGETESLQYLHRRLERMGVIDRLRDLGVKDGDTVRIAGWEFEYEE